MRRAFLFVFLLLFLKCENIAVGEKDTGANDKDQGVTDKYEETAGDIEPEDAIATDDWIPEFVESKDSDTGVEDIQFEDFHEEFIDVFICSAPGQCEGFPHDLCLGYWTCMEGKCNWNCEAECVKEGDFVPVIPDAPECCEGLLKLPCDYPDENGDCQFCLGASVCAKCGDNFCGSGENLCNCPEDCNEIKPCLGLGGTFLDFNTKDKCCDGLTPLPDCDIGEGGCLCKKCPCYICLLYGDGECGAFEHICNSPKECASKEKAMPYEQSECEGDAYNADPAGKLFIEPGKNSLKFIHTEFPMNCCLKIEMKFIPMPAEIYVMEKIPEPFEPCFCNCLFTLAGAIDGIKSGSYTLTLFNEEQDKVVQQTGVVIP